MGRSRYKIFEDTAPHFLTCTLVNWLPLFSDPGIVEVILDSLRHLQNHERLQLCAFVIMENHLHLIASSGSLSREIARFKSYTARKTIDYLEDNHARSILKQLQFFRPDHKLGSTYQLWQEGS